MVSSSGLAAFFIGYAVVDVRPVHKILMGIGGGLFVVLTARLLRAGIALGPEGVRVCRVFSDVHACWDEVKAFGFTRSNPFNRGSHITVDLADGSRLTTTGLTCAAVDSRFALRVRKEMCELRDSFAPRPSGQINGDQTS